MQILLCGFLAAGACTRVPRVAQDHPVHVGGLASPESAIWDPTDDVYLVSNIDGFIARIAPDGRPIDRWRDGASPGQTLHTPRGLALAGDRLLVADGTAIRVLDRRTGAPLASIDVPGATMLNDVAVRGNHVIVTDSGLGGSKQPVTATHGVYDVDLTSGTSTPLLVGRDLGRPNGIAVVGDAIWIATYASGELFRICEGGVCERQRLPAGGLDGIVVDGNDWYVSSWDASAIFVGRPGGAWTIAIAHVPAPADIGWDSRRRRLLVPLLEAGALELHHVPDPSRARSRRAR